MEQRALRFDGAEIAYALRRSDRARRLRLVVGSDGNVAVVLPAGCEEREATAFVAENVDWIRRHQERIRTLAERAPLNLWCDGGHLMLLGRQYRLRVLPSRGRRGAVTVQCGEVLLEGAGLTPERLAGVVGRWLRTTAHVHLSARVAALAPLLGKLPSRVFVREQRTRWGSCSARGGLGFNWRLVMAPPEVVDYVVVHELTHLVEMHHTPRFWRLVGAHAPDYRAHRRWLREHGPLLRA